MLGAGLIAGFALGYYLNSKEGRQWRERTMEQLDEYGEEIGGIANEVSKLANNYATKATAKGMDFKDEVTERGQELASRARETVESGKDWVNETTDSLKSTVAKGKEIAENTLGEVESSFKRGVSKAKRKTDKNGKA